jgi:predicted phage tail protein
MKTLYLYGSLKESYGASFDMDVATPAEAIRAMCIQLPGFENAIRASNWRMVRGKLDASDEVDEEGLQVTLGNQKEMHLIPVLEGANSGAGMLIVGIVMIAAAFFTGGASIAAWGAMSTMLGGAGLGMAIGGIIASTTKIPSAGTSASGNERADDKASFLFDGPTNQSTQGVAVPRGYGRMLVGSIVISAGLYAEPMAV